jgi:hypothetical protein
VFGYIGVVVDRQLSNILECKMVVSTFPSTEQSFFLVIAWQVAEAMVSSSSSVAAVVVGGGRVDGLVGAGVVVGGRVD